MLGVTNKVIRLSYTGTCAIINRNAVFLASISLLLFDVSIVLNLPIFSLFFKSHPRLHDANKQIRFLKMQYVENLIVTEKSTTSITFKKCFLKHDVWATLYILRQCFYSN